MAKLLLNHSEKVQYIQDKPTDGVVSVKEPMRLAALEQALAATRDRWVRVIG